MIITLVIERDPDCNSDSIYSEDPCINVVQEKGTSDADLVMAYAEAYRFHTAE